MTWEDFLELYEHYIVNDESLSDYETMKDSNGFNGEFVYDMWQMIKFVKSDPMLNVCFDFIEAIKAAQQCVQLTAAGRGENDVVAESGGN